MDGRVPQMISPELQTRRFVLLRVSFCGDYNGDMMKGRSPPLPLRSRIPTKLSPP